MIINNSPLSVKTSSPDNFSWIKDLGALVMECNIDGLISRTWTANENREEHLSNIYLGRHVTDLYRKTSDETLDRIITCITTQKPQELYFRGSDFLQSNAQVFMRIIPCFYDPSLALMIINYPRSEEQVIEESWRKAAEAAGDGMWDVNIANGKIYFSSGWKKMLGYDDDEVSTELEDVFELVHPADLQAFKAHLKSHMDGKTPAFHQEYRVRCKDGSYKWMLSRGKLLSRTETGDPLRMVGIETDISYLKNIQESLRTSMDTFSSAFNYSSIGKALVSPDGRWLDVNHALCKMLGYSREEFLNMSFQEITYPDDLEMDLSMVQQMLRREIETYSLEKRYISKKGSIVWAMLKVSMVWSNEVKPDFFISQIIDITQEKGLVQELEEQKEKLLISTQELQEKIARLEELNYMIAHNLRGPVGNIRMIIDSLRKNEGIFSMEESMDHIFSSSNALMESLDTLMELSQIQLNKNIGFDECDLCALVEKIKVQLQSTIFQKKAIVTLSCECKTLRYPKQYLESILYNLISNALKYSRPEEAPRIDIRVFEDDGKNVIVVADNGLGIDLEKYGNKLFKLNGVLHQGFDSKGVGLFLTKTQIESLGGSISVESEVNKGSTFTVKL